MGIIPTPYLKLMYNMKKFLQTISEESHQMDGQMDGQHLFQSPSSFGGGQLSKYNQYVTCHTTKYQIPDHFYWNINHAYINMYNECLSATWYKCNLSTWEK